MGALTESPSTGLPLDYETIEVEGDTLAFLRAGAGDRLVMLLHGWPQTAECWASVIPHLSSTFTVVAPDLPGYGRSSPAAGGGEKRAMARQLSTLVTTLGFASVMVAGHDRGARVAHRWALDHSQQVTRLAVLDIIPMIAAMDRFEPNTIKRYWHWFFHQSSVAQRTIERDVRGYLWPFLAPLVTAGVIDPATADRYLASYEQPGRVQAFLADYRSSFASDLEADAHDARTCRTLGMPVLALWGGSGPLGAMDVLEVWREFARQIRGREIECGHYLAEERPIEIGSELSKFFMEGEVMRPHDR